MSRMRKWGDNMATKSMLKSIQIQDDDSARRFIEALEISKSKREVRHVEFTSRDIAGDEIKRFLGDLMECVGDEG
ncbi:hypothetical protein QE152_g38924 [Popillia japonica]|uniref:Uncharacterized protein n=1 Tax=Popillia japonica TaxID=7064 RepID=A0AAW1HVC0_POPJA